MTQVDGAQAGERVTLDTSDVDRQIGRELGGGQLKEPVSATDIRRWVPGLQYPNPLHYAQEHAPRSPAGGYLAEEARRRGFFHQTAPRPTWTPERLAEIDRQRSTWIRARAGERGRRFDDVSVGDAMVTRPIGPHTIATFTTEWRAF